MIIATNLTIDASSLPNGITISANSSSRIFQVNSNVNVTLDSLTLNGGNVEVGTAPNNGGGAILNAGNLTLNNCTVQNSQANGLLGGGIKSYNGALTVSNSTFYGNYAYIGGALETDSGGTCALFNSTFSGNSAGAVGGAMYNGWSSSANNCTIVGNSAGSGDSGSGGGIFNAVILSLTNTSWRETPRPPFPTSTLSLGQTT